MRESFSGTVLHVFGRMVRGGAELRTLELMRKLDRQRFRLMFVALSGLPGELDATIRSLGGDVLPIGLTPAFPFKFKSLLRRERVCAVHSHVHLFSGFILALARSEGVPVRIAHFRSMHDGSRATLRKRWQNTLMRYWTGKHATNILAVSEGAMCSAWKADWQNDRRCEIVYNGLELAAFAGSADRGGVRSEFGLPADARICIHVGRMVEAKNHPRLLSIFAGLAGKTDDCFLLLVGRGDAEKVQALRSQAQAYGIGGRLLFAGERQDVPRLLKAADLLLFPSLWEGLPGSVLEACAAGIPVLASDLPGVREIQAWLPDRVRTLALTEKDEIWAAAAASLLKLPPEPDFSVHSVFDNTPFQLELTAERLSRMWANCQ